MTENNHAEQNARAHLESIIAMMDRNQHIEECDGNDCELSAKEIYHGLGQLLDPKGPTPEERACYHDQDDLDRQVHEDPLSIEIRSGWASVGETLEPEEFKLLLTTGGPACRIIGELNEAHEPTKARIQYQDWGTPWEDLQTAEGDQELLAYASFFYYGW